MMKYGFCWFLDMKQERPRKEIYIETRKGNESVLVWCLSLSESGRDSE